MGETGPCVPDGRGRGTSTSAPRTPRRDGPAPSPLVLAGAARVGVEASSLRPTDGRSGLTWYAGDDVLRLVPLRRAASELAARNAVAGVLPVPAVLRRDETDGHVVLLEQRLPGRPGHLDRSGAPLDPVRARRRGVASGAVHAALSRVVAPGGMRGARSAPRGGTSILHLDLHPFNVLVDDGDEVSAVIDWVNAAAGDPALDRARTWALLTAHPATTALGRTESGRAFLEGWAEAGDFDALDDEVRRWGLRFFLDDQAGILGEAELARARRLLADLGSDRER